MRILFAGSPLIAVPSLEALSDLETGEKITLAGVLTNPDSRRGRSGSPEPTDVSAAAERLSLARRGKNLPPIVQLKPEKLDARFREEVSALGADLLVSFAYGRIFGPKFLGLFPLGGVNIHPSLLPRYRGAAPIPAAILNRDRETGVSIQKLAPEMDTGDILAQERIPLEGRETTASLSETAARTAAGMLPRFLRDFTAGCLRPRPQEGEAVYCSLIAKEQGRIDWKAGAAEIDARVRAFTPWPLSFTQRGEETLYILEGEVGGEEYEAPKGGEAAPGGSGSPPGMVIGIDRGRGILIQTGNGIYAVSRLQWQAKKALDWKSFLNGARDFTGSVLQ